MKPFLKPSTFPQFQPWHRKSNGKSKDRKPGDFGLRGFYPADAKGQYDMQVGAVEFRSIFCVQTGGLLGEWWVYIGCTVNERN